jgi:hypothetical protein
MYSVAMPQCNLQRNTRVRRVLHAGYRLNGLGDACVIDATTGLRICGSQATAANVATGVTTPTTPTSNCSVGMPRYKGPGYFDWKPPDKEHQRRYAFQYHAGIYDQYGCVPGIADCNSRYNDMLAGPTGEWQPGRLAQDESKCVAVNPVTTTPGTPTVAMVSTNGTTTFPAITSGGAVTTAWPATWGSGYQQTSAQTEASQPTGVLTSLTNAWSGLPTLGKAAVGMGGALLAMKYLKPGRR